MSPATLPAIEFDPPLVNPSPNGLFPVVQWAEVGDGPVRYLGDGVHVRTINYGAADSSGVWDVAWCGDPGDSLKSGERPDFPDAFAPVTVWAFDQCDPTSSSRQEVQDHAAQWLRIQEQTDVEHAFAVRMLDDAGTPDTADDIVGAISRLEGLLAVTNTVGFIHASATWAASAAQAQLITRSGGALKTPMGHTWVFGGGYVDGLVDNIVATSQVFGWRDSPTVRTTIEPRYNQFVAIAERTFAVGYESLVGAVNVTG